MAMHPEVFLALSDGRVVCMLSITSQTSLMDRHRAAVVSEIKILLLANAVCVSSMVGSWRNRLTVSGLICVITFVSESFKCFFSEAAVVFCW
jgi:hypothetical protein